MMSPERRKEVKEEEAEVLGVEEAWEKYKTAIETLGGAKAYYDCARKARAEGLGVRGIAACLKGLKEALTEEDWADKWVLAYDPVGGKAFIERRKKKAK
jgi:hypothetical protein